ncbi:MAG: FkbM family methyltransferase [Candidatus Nanohaloarchaea archaeon]
MTLEDEKLKFHSQDTISKTWFHTPSRQNLREEKILKFFKNILDPGDTFFDVGSHIGVYSVIAGLNAGPVYAFDIEDRCLEILERNLKLNQVKDFKVENVAVGKSEDHALFCSTPSPDFSHIVSEEKMLPCLIGNLEEIQRITLDGYVRRNKVVPDIVKIDVEGAESDVLKGSTRLLQTHSPEFLIEIHERRFQERSSEYEEDPISILENYGYDVFRVDRDTGKLEEWEAPELRGREFLYAVSEKSGSEI